MTLAVRIRHMPTHPRPNVVEEATLSRGYVFHAVVQAIDDAIDAQRSVALRREDGTMLLLDPVDLQTIAVRETH